MKRAKETQTIIMASSASTHVTTTTQQNARKRWRFEGGGSRCAPPSRASFLSHKRRSFASSRRRRHTSSSSSFVVFVRNEWDNDSTTLRRTATKNEDDVLDHTRTSTNAKTTTTGSFRSSLITMMSPIQLQDVARKQFEDRERRRAQQVRLQRLFPKSMHIRLSIFFLSFLPPNTKRRGCLRLTHIDITWFCLLTHQAEDRLRDFRSGRFQPPNREKMSFNKATPHFFSAGVTPPNAGGGAFSLDAAVFERLETC